MCYGRPGTDYISPRVDHAVLLRITQYRLTDSSHGCVRSRRVSIGCRNAAMIVSMQPLMQGAPQLLHFDNITVLVQTILNNMPSV
jgi:hypothetical protein